MCYWHGVVNQYSNNETNHLNEYIQLLQGITADHVEFKYMDGRPGSRASTVFDVFNDGRNGADCNGHGTHVAGLLGGLNAGVAKNVQIRALRALDCEGDGDTNNIIAAIDWLLLNKEPMSLASLSFAGPFSAALNQAIDKLTASGTPAIVAAGNDGDDACSHSPASSASVITVGATDADDTRPSWSNSGPWVIQLSWLKDTLESVGMLFLSIQFILYPKRRC